MDTQEESAAFDLNSEQKAILNTADQYAQKYVAPLAERMDNEEWWPDEEFRALGKMGYLGTTVPIEYGGTGMDILSSGLVLQAFSRYNAAFALSWVAHDNLCTNNIFRNSDEHLRKKYLPGLCNGSYVGALGLTEPGAGSDALGSMATTARLEGDHYVLNGRKLFITNGSVADVLLVYAKTEMSMGTKGISAFVVEKGFPGFQVAQKLIKMGFRGSPTAELVFDDCQVPLENVVGAENQGHIVVMSGLDLERAMISPIAVGIAERALQLSLEYAKQREQFGRPIASFQMIQSRLSDMYVLVETMKTFNYRCLAACNEVEVGQGGRGGIHKLTAASIMYTTNSLNTVLDHAVQIHGGMGYMWESEINRLYRNIKLLEIGAGTTEVRKMIIAEELINNG